MWFNMSMAENGGKEGINMGGVKVGDGLVI